MAGVPLTGKIVPLNDGAFPVFEDINGQGGLRAVADIAARDAIPDNSRKVGMVVVTQDDGVQYQLVGGIDNADYQIVVPSSLRPLSKVYYVDAASITAVANGSIAAPYATIPAALAAASAASVTSCQIYVARGTYPAAFTAPAGMAVQIEAMAADNIDDFTTATASSQSPVRLQGAITHANTSVNSSLVISKCSIEVDITYTGTLPALLHLISSPMRTTQVVNGNGGTSTLYTIIVTAAISTQIGGWDTRGQVFMTNAVVVPNIAHKYDAGQLRCESVNWGLGQTGTFPVVNTYDDGSQFKGVGGFKAGIVFNGASKSFLWYFSEGTLRQAHGSITITYTTANTTYGPIIYSIDKDWTLQEYPYWGSDGAPFAPVAGALTLSFRPSYIGAWPIRLNQDTTVTLDPLPMFTQWIKVRFIQDATGGRKITFLTSMKWRDGRVGLIDGRPNAETVFWVLANTMANGTTVLEDAHLVPIVSLTPVVSTYMGPVSSTLAAVVAATDLLKSPAGAGLYNLQAYLTIKTAGTSGLLTVNAIYTDSSGVTQTVPITAAVDIATIGNHGQGSLPIECNGASAVQYSVTSSGSYTPGALSYSLRISVTPVAN